jgi:SAM-dependent methyltransferase
MTPRSARFWVNVPALKGKNVVESERQGLPYREIFLDKINRAAYSSRAALKYFDRPRMDLFEAERVILEQLTPQIKDKKLFDIGVGAGRTTHFLRKLSHNYTGIDSSRPLLDRAKAKFGIETLYLCDVRDLSFFAPEKFDFAMCSFNGLDYISHRDRLRALHEIHRVLKPDGFFVFSAHNRGFPHGTEPSGRKTTMRSFLRSNLLQLGHWGLRPFEVFEKQYAILHDSWIGRYHPVFTYYIDVLGQVEQLQECGFDRVEAYDMHGRKIRDDHESPWIHYVARKCRAPA